MNPEPYTDDWWENRPYQFYWTNLPFECDLLLWHNLGIRLGEA